MTVEAKRYDIARIEHPCSVVLDIDDMMDLQKRFLVIVHHAALLAGELVTHQYRSAELCVSLVTALASRLITILDSESNEVEVSSKPIWILIGIEVPMVNAAFPLAIDGSIGFLSESFVPNRPTRQLRFSAIRMVSAFEVRNSEAPAFGFQTINGKGGELLSAPAFANDFDASRLCLGNAHDFSFTGERIAYSGKNEKGVNCWDPLTVTPRAISSQGLQECSHGSTTRAWSPERTVKPHECTPRKGRYSLGCMETCRSEGLNTLAITEPTLQRKIRRSQSMGR